MEISAVSHARGRVFDALERMGGDPTMELWRLIRAAFDAETSAAADASVRELQMTHMLDDVSRPRGFSFTVFPQTCCRFLADSAGYRLPESVAFVTQ